MMQSGFTQASFQARLEEHRLVGSKCQTCFESFLPARPMCPACHEQEMIEHEMSGEGEIAAFTVIYIAPTAMVQAGYGRDKPYCSAIIRLAEGPSISGQLIGFDLSQPHSIAIGTAVRAAFIGDAGNTSLAFLPVDVSGSW